MNQVEGHSNLHFILPQWPAPANVRALTTTRQTPGATSCGAYAAFNLALHVADEPVRVEANRNCLMKVAKLPASPAWLNQTHGNTVVHAETVSRCKPVAADASVTQKINTVCAVLTADCLPVFFCNRAGTEVAVAHAGWRGLYAGVLEQTVLSMQSAAADLLVWFGPAIGPAAFEVGLDVRQFFGEKNRHTISAFKKVDASHYLCDLYQLARLQLEVVGVQAFYGGGLCTFSDAEDFYSYRRDGETGRMASLIWLDQLDQPHA